MFSLPLAPAGVRSRSRRVPNRFFLPQHTPLRPPESLAFLEREPTPRRLFRRPAFGGFCIVSHETSAFSVFSTCPILPCFCQVIIAYLRDFERKPRFLSAFPSHDRSPTVVFARQWWHEPRQTEEALDPQQTGAQTRKTRRECAGWEKVWRTARARPSGIKTSIGRRLSISCKTRMKGSFYALLCHGDTRGIEGGGGERS